MQIQQTITLFGTVSNSASSSITKNGRKYSVEARCSRHSARGLPPLSQTCKLLRRESVACGWLTHIVCGVVELF